MKHTPGPWRASDTEEIYAGRTIVAATYSSEDYMLRPDGEATSIPNSKSARSNARLIAAAPELLEAAKHLFTCDFSDEVDFRCKGCEAARAAIAKATGGAI